MRSESKVHSSRNGSNAADSGTEKDKIDAPQGNKDVADDGNKDLAMNSKPDKGGERIHVYKRRWPVLLLFCACSLSNAYQWIHLNIVFDVVKTHYNASLPADPTQANIAIDWLSMIYMLAYFLFMLPAAWVLQRFGLRVGNICAAALNFAGAFIKCFASNSASFWLLFFGQTVCASAQSFILGFPAPLAAAWFGINELSTATAMGVFGNQIGVAVGFVLPPLFISKGDGMQQQLLGMFIGGACVTGLILVLMLFLFPDLPPLPPSLGQLAVRESREAAASKAAEQRKGSLGPYLASLRRLVTNPNFVLLTVSYGINTGTFYGLSTLLNPIVVPEFQKHNNGTTGAMADVEQHLGWAAFTMVIAGIAGSVLAGFVLDRTKQFKLTTLVIYVLSCLSTVLFTATLPLARMWIVYLSMFLLGIFMTGYLPVGFEFAAELTYPENEGLSSGFLNAAAQLTGIILTISVRAIIDQVSTLAGNIGFCVLLVVGSILTAIIKSDLRRQRANRTIEIDIEDPEETEYLKKPIPDAEPPPYPTEI